MPNTDEELFEAELKHIQEEKHDLIYQIDKLADEHFMLGSGGLIAFTRHHGPYHDGWMDKLERDNLKRTWLIEQAQDLYKDFEHPYPKWLKKKEEEVKLWSANLSARAADATNLFALEESSGIKEIMTAGPDSSEERQKQRKKLEESLPHYYLNGWLQYQRGDYDEALIIFENFIHALGDKGHFTTRRHFYALFGRLAAIIKTGEWRKAKDAVDAIDKAIMLCKRREDYEDEEDCDRDDQDLNQVITMTDKRKLTNRSMLLTWSLFTIPETPEAAQQREQHGAEKKWDFMLDLIFLTSDDKQSGPGNGPDRFRQSLQNHIPWLLRYVTALAILHKPSANGARFRRKQDLIKEVVRLIEEENYEYSDPITSFLHSLYVRFDFDRAQEQLKACEEVLQRDYFLQRWTDKFVEEGRHLIFEIYCRIHQKVDIDMLGQKLGMTPDAAEAWMVELIQKSLLNARIDTQNNYIEMRTRTPSVYQQILDRTGRLGDATQRLAQETTRALQAAQAREGLGDGEYDREEDREERRGGLGRGYSKRAEALKEDFGAGGGERDRPRGGGRGRGGWRGYS